MLQRASAATYTVDRIQSIPEALRSRYLLPADSASGFHIAPRVRALVDFARQNLIDPLPPGHFSVIFCRNVMLYFDRSTHQSLIHRLTAHLEPGGYLFIGHTESLNGIVHSLEPAAPAVFRKSACRTDITQACTASVRDSTGAVYASSLIDRKGKVVA